MATNLAPWTGSILIAALLGFWLGLRLTRGLVNKAGAIARQTLPLVQAMERDIGRAIYFYAMAVRLVDADTDEEAAQIREEMEKFRAEGEQLG